MNEAVAILIVLAVWWAIGMAFFLHVCWIITPIITVRDVLVGLLAGMLGPFGALNYLYVLEYMRWPSWLDTELIRKRYD